MAKHRRRLVVVAHPDDETLWAGGLIATYPGRWTVVCCTIPRRDPIRIQKFARACDKLGAVGLSIPVEETEAGRSLDLLSFRIPIAGHSLLVTHGLSGEYGHNHHMQIGNQLRNRSRFMPVLKFGLTPAGHAGAIRLDLDPIALKNKLAALRCYDHVMPYRGRDMPKWEALLAEYQERRGIDLGVETYDLGLPDD